MSTREALFAFQVLFQRCRYVNKDIYACFINYHEPFGTVKHDRLIKILENIGIDEKDLRVAINPYWRQSANIKIKGNLSDKIENKGGVQQGCILSSLLFNTYSEQIFIEVPQDVNAGIPVNEERLNNIRYSENSVLFADSFYGLQELMTNVTVISQQYGLELNIKKAKY